MHTDPDRPQLYQSVLLKLVIKARFGGWVTGFLIFAMMFGIYHNFADPRYTDTYSVVFLSAMIGYMVPIYALIIRTSQQAFDATAHLLDLDSTAKKLWRYELDHHSFNHHLYASLGGFLLGASHVMILETSRTGSPGTILHSSTAAVTAFASLLIWMVMTIVISSVMRNAVAFQKLGRDHLRVELLHARELIPLGWVSVVSTLSLIGALALYGLLLLDDSGWEVLLPATLGTALPMLPMFLLPIWSIHKRLQALKKAELEAIGQQLDIKQEFVANPLQHPESLGRLNDLLAYRNEIQAVPEWPFDLSAMSRLGFYLIIPPLTWVGAALIENLVDAVI